MQFTAMHFCVMAFLCTRFHNEDISIYVDILARFFCGFTVHMNIFIIRNVTNFVMSIFDTSRREVPRQTEEVLNCHSGLLKLKS